MKKSLRTAAAAVATSFVALAASGSAMAAGPTGDYAPFKYCPYQNTSLTTCLVSTTTSGAFKLGNSNVPISAPIVLQGGFNFNGSTTTWYNAGNGGVTLSNTPLNVPGGLLGLVNPGGFFGLLEQAFESAISTANGVTATAELVGPVKFDFFAYLTGAAPAVTLPIRVHLQNPFLGPSCYVGSSGSPITLKLTDGTTSPPAGTAPLTGSHGTLTTNDDGTVGTATGVSLVDNTFTVPAATGCGYLPLDKLLITAAVNLKEGWPAGAGKNSAVLNGSTQLGTADAVRASAQ